MIRLHVVGDGPRDERTIPHLVAGILAEAVEPTFSPWARLQGKGLPAKIMFATRQAKDAQAKGLVAVVDADRDPKRIAQLRQGRELERQKYAPYPTALGQAEPHAEAWLLDDPLAVRESLELPPETEIESVATVRHPKTLLNEILRQCPRCEEDWMSLLAAIAARLDPTRCIQRDRTGFREFEEEVRAEIGPLMSRVD